MISIVAGVASTALRIFARFSRAVVTARKMGAVPIGLMTTKQTTKAFRKFSITSFGCVGADASSVDKNAPSGIFTALPI